MDNKTLTETVSRRTGISRKDSAAMFAALADAVRAAAAELDTVAVPGFGNFETKKRPERVMAVPSSGRKLLLPPKISLNFRPAAALKQQLRDSSDSE